MPPFQQNNTSGRRAAANATVADSAGRIAPRDTRLEAAVLGALMLEKDAYCMDIMIQVSAVNAAINSFSKELLGAHLRTCVAENLRQGNDEVIDELVNVLQKLMK